MKSPRFKEKLKESEYIEDNDTLAKMYKFYNPSNEFVNLKEFRD